MELPFVVDAINYFVSGFLATVTTLFVLAVPNIASTFAFSAASLRSSNFPSATLPRIPSKTIITTSSTNVNPDCF